MADVRYPLHHRSEPRLLVIGAYRMGFTIAAQGDRSRLVVWCTRRMATDAVAAFAGVPNG